MKPAEVPPKDEGQAEKALPDASWNVPPPSWHVDAIEATVHQRIAAILRELPAIGKTEENKEQRFLFRSHDAVLNALNPLLAKYGVFIVPSVLERIASSRTTSRGSTMYEVNLLVGYRLYGPQGDYVTASAWGEGTDMGDKSTNKAMTMAFKNVLAQVFAVSTADTIDSDDVSMEETTRASAGRGSGGAQQGSGGRAAPPPGPKVPELFEALKAYTDEPGDFIREAVELKHGIDYPENFGALPTEVKQDTYKRLIDVVQLLRQRSSDLAVEPLAMPPTDLAALVTNSFQDVWDVKIEGPTTFVPPVPFL